MKIRTALLLLGFVLWFVVAVVSLLAFDHTREINAELRTQIELLRKLRKSETEQCVGIYKVNTVCEKVVTGFATQLGLELEGPSQILTTGIVERYRVREGGMGGE